MTMPPPTVYMTPEALKSWRYSLNLSKREAAKALGCARNTFRAYEMGKYPVPRYIYLATVTISAMHEVKAAA